MYRGEAWSDDVDFWIFYTVQYLSYFLLNTNFKNTGVLFFGLYN
jgi:hypothetical protein